MAIHGQFGKLKTEDLQWLKDRTANYRDRLGLAAPMHEVPEYLAEAVELLTGIPIEQAMLRSRKQPVVMARRLVMAALRYCHRQSFADIGQIFQLDHSTIIHQIQQHDKYISMVNGQVVHEPYNACYITIAELYVRCYMAEG